MSARQADTAWKGRPSISKRRWRALATLVCAALLCGAGFGCAAPEGARPDVLLITIDTLRADRLGSYGFRLPTSPAIDRLAGQGVVFERAIAGASFTAASHASIMASRYTREHTIGYENGTTRLQDITTLAEILQRDGYQTAAFVGNLVLDHSSGLDRGFAVYDDELTDAEPNRPYFFERIAEKTTRRAIRWLQDRDAGPFFLWVHYQDPHGPYTPPPDFAGRFPPQSTPEEKMLPFLSGDAGLNGIPAYQEIEGIHRPSIYEARYAEEIAYADHWIGRLLAQVDAAASEAGAIVALTADHGESLGEEGRYFMHGNSTKPDQAHVPLILRAPGLAAGRRPELVHHVDIMPTILELVGLEIPPKLSGIALGPVLRGESPLPERFVYCDEGADLSAYATDGFVRVEGVKGAWQTGSATELEGMAPRWAAYRWVPGHAWRALDSPDASAKDAIRSYFRQAIPMVESQGHTETRARMLRALGYAE